MTRFPVIDISVFADGSRSERRALAAQVDEVCRFTGFLAIVGHGVPVTIMDAAWQATRGFFDLPLERKLAVRMPHDGYPYGYAPLQGEALARSRGEESPADLKESFSIGPDEQAAGLADEPFADFRYATNLWPEEPPGFRAAWSACYRELDQLAVRLMRVFAIALGLPEDYFDDYIDRPISALRALNYPALSTPPQPGQVRAGAHTDYGSLTVLRADAAPGGLEIRSPAGEWQPVPPVPDGFVVNIGDLMARWTNDRWVSTLHRVVNPPAAAGKEARRQSMAYFHQPNWDAVVACLPGCLDPGAAPRYAPVRSGEYLMRKFHSTVQARAGDT